MLISLTATLIDFGLVDSSKRLVYVYSSAVSAVYFFSVRTLLNLNYSFSTYSIAFMYDIWRISLDCDSSRECFWLSYSF